MTPLQGAVKKKTDVMLRWSVVILLTVCLAAGLISQVAFADEGGPQGGITLSHNNDAATIAGQSFAVDKFFRAQVGSNRAIEGVYRGYVYYSGNSPEQLAFVATTDYVVVYTSESARESGFDPSDPTKIEALKECLVALDGANANGGAQVSYDQTWYFTEDDHFVVDSVEFSFNQELKEGSFYSGAIGVDGSDITSLENPSYVRLTHADFGMMVNEGDANIAVAPSSWEAFTSFMQGIDLSPLWVTLKTTGVAIVFIFILGLAAAYFSLRIPSGWQNVVDSIFTIPMVLPPTVCGFILLWVLGRNSPIGGWFIDVGLPLVFSWPATVIAAVVVAFPLMYRSARGAFEGLDQNMLDAARTLGWSNSKVFFKLMLPLSWSSVAAGTVLALARALGEFGATLFLAGNFVGITRTIPIAIYFEWMNGNTNVAVFWTVVIIVFCFIVILIINLFSKRTTKYRKAVKE